MRYTQKENVYTYRLKSVSVSLPPEEGPAQQWLSEHSS